MAELAAPSKSLVRVKDFAWLVYLYPLRWISVVAPVDWFRALGDMASRLGAKSLPRARARLVARLAVAFGAECDERRLQEIADAYFRRAIFRFFDDLLLARVPPPRLLRNVTLTGREHLDDALARGRGALLVSGHLCASRLAKRHLASIGYPALTVRNHVPPDPVAGRLGRALLLPRYVALVGKALGEEVALQDPECSLKMLARLRAGGLVDCHVDVMLSQEVVTRPFLGADMRLAAGYLHVARLAGCPLVPIHCRGDSRDLAIDIGAPFSLVPAADRGAFVQANVAQIAALLEAQVRRDPAEWDMWFRW
jgi:KDO2-lipid IV(A) lauroyltransferase